MTSFVHVVKEDNGANGYLVLAEVETQSSGLHVTKINVHNRGTTKTFTFDFPSGGQYVISNAGADTLNEFSVSIADPAPNLNLRLGGWSDDANVYPKLFDGANEFGSADITVS